MAIGGGRDFYWRGGRSFRIMNKPNIIFILADDLGCGDISANIEHITFQTKNINHIASEGIAHKSSTFCFPYCYTFITDFISRVRSFDIRSTSDLSSSLESHFMAFAAEESRLSGGGEKKLTLPHFRSKAVSVCSLKRSASCAFCRTGRVLPELPRKSR